MAGEGMTEVERELDARARALAATLVGRATAAGMMIATAESCTAGMVASYIASVPGASAVLRGGAATYCDEVKHDVLGVSEQTLAEHTAVSSETALEMVRGARRVFRADIAASLTGYAGPDGGTEADPAGTVYIAVAGPEGASCRRFSFKGTRNEVRLRAACAALKMLDALL